MNSELKILQALAVAERFGTATLGKKNFTVHELREKVKPVYPLPPFQDKYAYTRKHQITQEFSIDSIFSDLLKRMEKEKNKALKKTN
jgi:hypothetical protein